MGPQNYEDFYPPVIAANKGKWLYHEILEPGVLVHVSETGDEVYTIRVGGARLMSVTHIREICEIADKHCGGYLSVKSQTNIVTDICGSPPETILNSWWTAKIKWSR